MSLLKENYKYEVCRHCTNDSRGIYCPRMNALYKGGLMFEKGWPLFGLDAIGFIKQIIAEIRTDEGGQIDHVADLREYTYKVSLTSGQKLMVEIIMNDPNEHDYKWPSVFGPNAIALLKDILEEAERLEKEGR